MAGASTIVAALCIFLIALLAANVLWTSRRARASKVRKLYEDNDGVSTDESQKRYFYLVRVVRFLLLAIWGLGFSASLGVSVSRTASSEDAQILETWLTFGAWVRSPIQRVSYKQVCLTMLVGPSLFAALQIHPRAQTPPDLFLSTCQRSSIVLHRVISSLSKYTCTLQPVAKSRIRCILPSRCCPVRSGSLSSAAFTMP